MSPVRRAEPIVAEATSDDIGLMMEGVMTTGFTH